MLITNAKTYDFIKRLVQVGLPAFSSLYFSLAQIYGMPGAEKVVGTCAVVATFLGVLLGISNKKYNESDDAYDGKFVVSDNADGRLVTLELNGDPDELVNMKNVRFKVSQE